MKEPFVIKLAKVTAYWHWWATTEQVVFGWECRMTAWSELGQGRKREMLQSFTVLRKHCLCLPRHQARC